MTVLIQLRNRRPTAQQTALCWTPMPAAPLLPADDPARAAPPARVHVGKPEDLFPTPFVGQRVALRTPSRGPVELAQTRQLPWQEAQHSCHGMFLRHAQISEKKM